MRAIVATTLAMIMLTCFIPAKANDPVMTFGDYDNPIRATISGANAVFDRTIDGQSDLWLANIASGEEKRLTQTPAIESNPVFVGDKIIYSTRTDWRSPSDLAIMDLDGNWSSFSSLPGDESRFWVFDNLVIWVVDDSGKFSIWCLDLKGGKRTLIRPVSPEMPTHILSNGGKVFWTQQDDETDLDVWMFDFATGKSEGICVEPGDQYCVSVEGNWLAIIGRYVFRPDRDLFVYNISEALEIPVDTTTEDITSAAISNGHLAFLKQPLSTTIDCKLMITRLSMDEIKPEVVSKVPLTEKERLFFSWPLAIWCDKRDYYDKGIDIWAYNFSKGWSIPVSLDPGDQYLLDIKSSLVAFLTSRFGKFGLTLKVLND